MIRLVAALLLVLSATPALALLPAAPAAPTTSPEPQPTIAATQEADTDTRIAERIRGIFGELPAFADVAVEARQGVVVLTGDVPDQEDIARAEAIAGRVVGVVTVENRLERDLSISPAGPGLNSLAERWDGFVRLLPLIAVALAIWLGFSLVGYLLAGLGAVWHRLAPNSFLAELLASAIRFAFIVGGLVVALDILGAGALLGAVLGGAGLLGIALGFAMRDTIENYVASLMLSLRQPFRANDHVVIDGHEGRVIRLTSRATVLMTLDGNHLRVPNGQVFRAVILNYTRNPQRRFDFTLGIDAGDDPAAARETGRAALAALPFVLADPPPEVRIVEVGDSNIVLNFLAWIDQGASDWYKARSRAIASVKDTLESAGFALPEPIYRLRFDPRTGPLPLETLAVPGTAQPAPTPAPSAPAPAPPPAAADVAPDDEVRRMVDAERAQAAPHRDLLDSNRPVE